MKKFNFKKTAASIAAFTLVLSAAVSPNASLISELIPMNSISASAITVYTSGDWQYTVTGTYTCEITKYKGSASSVIVPVAIDGRTVTSIGNAAFFNNKTITSVQIPKGITEINPRTFQDCKNLTNVILPNGITKIGSEAFENTNISSFTFPSNLEEIGFSAFSGTKLTSITIPSSVTTIDGYAFYGTNLSSVSIPTNVKFVGNVAFGNCKNLSSVKFLGTPEFKDEVFRGSDKVKNISMNTIAFDNAAKAGAFKGCTNLESINGTKLVGYYSYGRPYFASRYRSSIVNNFEKFDCSSPDGYGKVGFYEEYLKAEIKYIATTQTANCTTDAQKVKALHDWICNKVSYAYTSSGAIDYGQKNCIDSTVFLHNKAICEGYARGYNLLLQAVGIEAYYAKNTGVHAWNIVKLGGRYFHIDVCHDDGLGDYSHYLKSDTAIKKCESGHAKWSIYKPSYLHNYEKNVTTPACNYSLGDVNKDGKVDNADQNYLLNYIVNNKGYTIAAGDKVLADTNFDGKIDICDATAINKFKD